MIRKRCYNTGKLWAPFIVGPIYQISLLRETLLRGLPVDDIPDGAEVLSLAVLVLQARIDGEHGKGVSQE